jgi:hypothetical protein
MSAKQGFHRLRVVNHWFPPPVAPLGARFAVVQHAEKDNRGRNSLQSGECRLRTVSLNALQLLSALAVLSSAAAHADDNGPCGALFDRPVAVQTVPASSRAGPGEDVTCTYYRDFMVRETETNSPGPNSERPATIISVSDASRRPGL